MKAIHLAIPITLLTLFCAAMIFISDARWSIGMGIGLVSLVAIFMLKDAIDWRYYQKYPPQLDSQIKLLLHHVPFYKQLDDAQQKKFELRLELFKLNHEYRLQPFRNQDEEEEIDAPEDIKYLSSVPAIILTMEDDDYLATQIELLVFYNHPFPSPRYKALHHSESNIEDKLLIFSIPNLRKGVLEPFVFLDIAMYEWAKILGKLDMTASWENFEASYGLTKSQIEAAIGLTNPDIRAISKLFQVHRSYLHLLK
ncbi:MAG: hypothetical protein IPP42_18180 [Saprospiraceae bacterium]|nr:hypothetical protein [Saprospiraceae bacterium]